MDVNLNHRIDGKTVKYLANTCIDDTMLLAELFQFLMKGSFRERFNASWILSHAVEKQPEILNDNHHASLILCFKTNKEGGIRRNLVRNWQYSIPEDQQLKCDIIELAFESLTDMSQDLAVRIFSISVLEKLLKFMPEIKDEVLFVIEKAYSSAKPSYRVRADRFIKAANKMH